MTRIYTVEEIYDIVDNGTRKEIQQAISDLSWSYPRGNKHVYAHIFDYFIKNTTGVMRLKALMGSDNYFSKDEFDSYLSLLNEDERIKILGESKFISFFPEEFTFIWKTKPTKRARILEDMPYSGSKYKGFNSWEEKFKDQEHQHLYIKELLDEQIFDVIDSTILDSSGTARAQYASKYWANPTILDVLKDDKIRDVINSVAYNPFISFDTAVYLIENHKTPDIRVSIARNTRDYDILRIIWDSTNSKQIREAVKENPFFKNTGIEDSK